MNENDIRKGILQAETLRKGGFIFWFEIFMMAFAGGMKLKSISAGIIIFFACLFLIPLLASRFRIVNRSIHLILSGLWGYIGYLICISFKTPVVSAVIIGGIVFLITASSRQIAFQYLDEG